MSIGIKVVIDCLHLNCFIDKYFKFFFPQKCYYLLSHGFCINSQLCRNFFDYLLSPYRI